MIVYILLVRREIENDIWKIMLLDSGNLTTSRDLPFDVNGKFHFDLVPSSDESQPGAAAFLDDTLDDNRLITKAFSDVDDSGNSLGILHQI